MTDCIGYFGLSLREFKSLIFIPFSSQEGKQASMAADFSVNQFSYIGRLLMVHGRNR